MFVYNERGERLDWTTGLVLTFLRVHPPFYTNASSTPYLTLCLCTGQGPGQCSFSFSLLSLSLLSPSLPSPFPPPSSTYYATDSPPSVSKCPCLCPMPDAQATLPKIEIVHRSLLVAHVDIKREQIDRRMRATTQDLEEGW